MGTNFRAVESTIYKPSREVNSTRVNLIVALQALDVEFMTVLKSAKSDRSSETKRPEYNNCS